MKSFEELCEIFKRIAKDPYAKVDYLTVRDYLQMRQHLQICADCDELTENIVRQEKKEANDFYGGTSEN